MAIESDCLVEIADSRDDGIFTNGLPAYRFRVMFPLMPASKHDFDWTLVELPNVYVAILDKVLRPNQISGEVTQRLSPKTISDQHPVTVPTAGTGPKAGPLTNVYSTSQVHGPPL